MADLFDKERSVVSGIGIWSEKIIFALKAIVEKPWAFLAGSVHINEAPLEFWNVVVWLAVYLLCFLFMGQCISR